MIVKNSKLCGFVTGCERQDLSVYQKAPLVMMPKITKRSAKVIEGQQETKTVQVRYKQKKWGRI